jgi:hypothetical protein
MFVDLMSCIGLLFYQFPGYFYESIDLTVGQKKDSAS